jgi:hypothetical protein
MRPARPEMQTSKKEYTFHIDLGIEFLFHLTVAVRVGLPIDNEGRKRAWR